MNDFFANKLNELKANGQFRSLPKLSSEFCVDFSTNDYLGIGENKELQQEFYSNYNIENSSLFKCGSTSSRLLAGNHLGYDLLESEIANAYNREAALVFNSGYHCNVGLLPALSDKNDLILSDRLNHASIVDGISLCNAKVMRYKHNDLNHLETLISKYHQQFEKIFIVSESVFSMDGDCINLSALCALKKKYNAMLIIDEAHSVGVMGKLGLGLAERENLIQEVDIIIGTFGKALASTGAYVVCNDVIKNYLINTMRTLIFTTALPPVIISWNRFVFKKMKKMHKEREKLEELSQLCQKKLNNNFGSSVSNSQIIPIIIGDNTTTLAIAKKMRKAGYNSSAIRPPTVPVNSSRLRLSLSASMSKTHLLEFINKLNEILP